MYTAPNKIDKVLDMVLLWAIPKFVTPNHVTVLRFVSIPFVVYFLMVKNYSVALPLFAFSAFTDAVDGALARTRDQVTDWGTIFDPVADKLLISFSAIILISNEISFVLAFLMVSVDAIIFLSAAKKYAVHKKISHPHWTGKTKMLLQSLGIGLLLLYLIWPLAIINILSIIILYLAVAFAIISFFVYRSA